MNTVITNRKMIGNKKVVILDSDCQFNIDAIKESIKIINKHKVDYGVLTLWGIELAITPDDIAEDVLRSFKDLKSSIRVKGDE